MKYPIILASSSPRRKELMNFTGLEYQIFSPDVDETEIPNEPAQDMVTRLSFDKSKVIAERNPDSIVIGADTTVCLNEVIYGKPLNKKDAFRMLKDLQGQIHSVFCGYTLYLKAKNTHNDKFVTWSKESKVTFAKLTDEQIENYIKTGEPMDKAGAYAAQGYGMTFITKIEGSYSNILGLDLPSLLEKIAEF